MRAIFYVHQSTSTFKRGWWLVWEMTEYDPGVIAMLDRDNPNSVIGSWPNSSVAEVLRGVESGSVTLERNEEVFTALVV